MALWRVELLGGLRATQAERVVTRFESGRIAALLAFLALFPRSHPREELIERLWPDVAPDVGRNRLRNVLAVLRSQLEPPGVPAGSVLTIDRFAVTLPPQNVETDVALWERLVRARRFAEAEALWKGELLPGFYDDWIVEERERLNALREGSLPAEPGRESPPSASEAETLVALPGYPTRYFGRNEEGELLASLLASERLVTITGTGGVGKTRLAVETARSLSEDFPGGVAFVALAQRWSADGLPEALLAALRLPPSRNPLEALRRHARRDRTLLLLDNFEQLVQAGGAETVASLLALTTGLTLLVTSRRVLGVDGERELPLLPLAIPEAALLCQEAFEVPGVALFVDRAQAVRPRFALRDDNVGAVLALCRRLEGLPLALELAASRTRGYTLAQMEAALDDRFALLTRPGGSSRKENRHASLRATVEWSWRLLSPASQRLFSRLSVFRRGATADAIREVCDEPEAQTLLEGLAADSLILTSGDDAGELRFSLLESLREFAAERLPEDDRAYVELRHAARFLALAASVADDDVRTLEPLERERENLDAALETAWERRRDDAFWDGLTGFLTFAFTRGYHRQAALWAERVAQSWRTVADPQRRFAALQGALGIYLDSGRFEEAQTLMEAMLADARKWKLPLWEVHARLNQGYLANVRGEWETAWTIQSAALARARMLDRSDLLVRSLFLAARATNTLAISLQPRELERARRLFETVEALCRETLSTIGPHSRMQSYCYLLRSIVFRHTGCREDAYVALKTAQRYALDHGALALLMFTFWHESWNLLEASWGSKLRAALCYGAFRRLREQMGYATPEADEEPDLQNALRETLGEETYRNQLRLADRLPLEALLTIA